MRSIKKALLVTAAALTTTVATFANAAIVSGTFTLDIYNGPGGGSSGASASQALLTNALIPGNLLGTFTYTGPLDFELFGNTNTISAFLASSGGTVAGPNTSSLSATLSAGGFSTATLFVFRDLPGWIAGTVRHDDGFSIYSNANLASPVASFSAPTTVRTTPFSLGNGPHTLVYVAANGNPSILEVDATPVPEPSTYVMMLAGLGLLGFMAKRRMG